MVLVIFIIFFLKSHIFSLGKGYIPRKNTPRVGTKKHFFVPTKKKSIFNFKTFTRTKGIRIPSFFGCWNKYPFEGTRIPKRYAHERDTYSFFFRVLEQVSLRRDTYPEKILIVIFYCASPFIPSQNKGYQVVSLRLHEYLFGCWNKEGIEAGIFYLFLRVSLYPFIPLSFYPFIPLSLRKRDTDKYCIPCKGCLHFAKNVFIFFFYKKK